MVRRSLGRQTATLEMARPCLYTPLGLSLESQHVQNGWMRLTTSPQVRSAFGRLQSMRPPSESTSNICGTWSRRRDETGSRVEVACQHVWSLNLASKHDRRKDPNCDEENAAQCPRYLGFLADVYDSV